MKNALKAILFLVCLSFIACKKNDIPGTAPVISFNFNGKNVQYSGDTTKLPYQGIKVKTVLLSFDSSVFEYVVIGGKDSSNYMEIVFQGPYPLSKSNISEMQMDGIVYVTNRSLYTCDNICDIKISIDKNNFLTGTFSGTLIEYQMQYQTSQTATVSGQFNNVTLP